MNNIDLDFENYDYNDLLQLFKIKDFSGSASHLLISSSVNCVDIIGFCPIIFIARKKYYPLK